MNKNINAVEPVGGNVVFRAGGCHNLPARMYEENGIPIVETTWELTDEQIEQITKTKQISIAVIGKSIQPISVQVV